MACGGIFALTGKNIAQKKNGAAPPPARPRTISLNKINSAGFSIAGNTDFEIS